MAASSEEKSSSSEAQDWRKKSGLSCSFFIFAALNLAMVIVGGDAAYLCPVQPMVPVYLIGKYVVLCNIQKHLCTNVDQARLW